MSAIPRGRARLRHRGNRPSRVNGLERPLAGLSLALVVVVVVLSLSLVATLTQDPSGGESPEPSGGTSQSTSSAAAEQAGAKFTRRQMVARAQAGLELARDWSLRFGREIYHATQVATCHRAMRDQFDPGRRSGSSSSGLPKASVVSTDWTRSHAEIVKTISTTMGWTKDAVEAIVRASESLAGNHTHDESLHVDYVDVHRLFDVDEMIPPEEADDSSLYLGGEESTGGGQEANSMAGQQQQQNSSTGSLPAEVGLSDMLEPEQANPPPGQTEAAAAAAGETMPEMLGTPQPLLAMQPAGTPMPEDARGEWRAQARYLRLERHPNFGDTPISLETSAVHVPVHIYPGEPQVMNAIAWSEDLTQVFRNNFVHNPKLTNQYFASPLGFMRLFPAQKWKIPRTDPDLYDARMRPWYVAGASSRKDVIVLVDSSGSMTGSRRDIAKGVVFEILDTLTDNDHFLVLKFNDQVQQVGVPACSKMRLERSSRPSGIPLKNTVFQRGLSPGGVPAGTPGSGGEPAGGDPQAAHPTAGTGEDGAVAGNGTTDIDSLYLLPANGRNVRYVKTNFTIPTSGIANFSHALVTAFEVLRKYQEHDQAGNVRQPLGSQCNQAIMLITDGSPSDFADIFERYNYPNAPVRVFTYLIGRETGDGTHTKMMACHNRGYYTHVINLAEVRETVQQYIPVMARPLVLNRTHPTTWTPAYGELTYQMLTDWIWESRRRERARSILAAGGTSPATSSAGSASTSKSFRPDIRVISSSSGVSSSAGFGAGGELAEGLPLGGDQLPDELAQLEAELDAVDIFGYQSNPDCFWETRRNDLMTTVVQPVYDPRNRSRVVEKFLNKNVWTKKESVVRTANLLGVAAADMSINDIVALAPSHKLGPNGYAIMLTNNGLVMHHPDLRSILEPFAGDPNSRSGASSRQARILKPFFSSLDFVQLEHILTQRELNSSLARETSGGPDGESKNFLALRDESVEGKHGWRELMTKRTLDCQRRVQSRRQSFYYKPLEVFPFTFIIAIPQPYGSHRLEAQVELKSAQLPEKLTTYFTTSDFDLWSVHPDYSYCDGPSNNSVTTLLDMMQRLEEGKLNEIQWRPAESTKPPLFSPDKIICDKQLVQSLVYDAAATYSFSDSCGPPQLSAESSLIGMFGVRFSFIATRSGLTRVRHYSQAGGATADEAGSPLATNIKREAMAFARRHARALDETYYSRTVDYNMLVNESAILVQVPFNAHLKIAERLARFELEGELGPDGGGGDPEGQQFGGPPGRTELKDMNLFDKLAILANSSSLHVIASQSVIVNEGAQRAVAGVAGVFYDYASFVMRLLNATNAQVFGGGAGGDRKKPASCYLQEGGGPQDRQQQDEACADEADPRAQIKCGLANDTLDCLLVDNNGYILVSEQLEFVGRHLRAYDSNLMSRLVALEVFHELNVTDYQSICVKQEEKSGGAGGSTSAAASATRLARSLLLGGLRALLANLAASLVHLSAVLATLGGLFGDLAHALLASHQQTAPPNYGPMANLQQQQQSFAAISALLPNKTYLRPCDRVLTRYETRPGSLAARESQAQFYATRCECPAWFVYEQVARTNLILLVVDSSGAPGGPCQAKCNSNRDHNHNDGDDDGQTSAQETNIDQQDSSAATGSARDDSLMTQYNIIGTSEEQVCSMFERESSLFRRKLDSCIAHHPDEEEIKLCGRASRSTSVSLVVLLAALVLSSRACAFGRERATPFV